MGRGRLSADPCCCVREAPPRSCGDNSTGGQVRAFREMRRSGVLIHCPSWVVTKRPQQQRCSIALSRGYVRAQFLAREPDSPGALCASQSFRAWPLPWKDSEPTKQNPSARAALAALEADLLAQGWERMRRAPGTKWYELRFRREKTASLLRPAPRLSTQRTVRLAASTTSGPAQATPRARRLRHP
jgi:hypothetical protein